METYKSGLLEAAKAKVVPIGSVAEETREDKFRRILLDRAARVKKHMGLMRNLGGSNYIADPEMVEAVIREMESDLADTAAVLRHAATRARRRSTQ